MESSANMEGRFFPIIMLVRRERRLSFVYLPRLTALRLEPLLEYCNDESDRTKSCHPPGATY